MDDSNILYYIVIGAIYVISRVLKKKKQNKETVPNEPSTTETVSEGTSKKPSTFEDLFKELTGEDFSEKTPEQPTVIEERPIQQEIIPTLKNHDEELVDLVPDKPVARDKPLFVRDEHFKIARKEEEILEEHDTVHDLLNDTDDLRRAIVLKEILDRKY